MSRLRKIPRVRVLALSFAACLQGVAAAECARADAALAGQYTLSGAMEVGSQLRLHANGRFDYMLSYGALDELASGCWSRNGQTVTLAVSRFKSNAPSDPLKFDRLDLKSGSGGELLRQFDDGHSGAYSR